MLDLDLVRGVASRIREGGRVEDFESEDLELKSWPTKRGGRTDEGKLAAILRENAVAFANASGGTLILGIREERDGTGTVLGCAGHDLDALRRMVYGGTRPPLTVDFVEIEVDEGVLVTMVVPKSPATHATSDGVRYRRVGRDNQIVYPEQDAAIAVSKGEDYSAAPAPEAGLDAVDGVEVARLRNWLERHNPDSGLRNLEDPALLRKLGLTRDHGGSTVSTVAGLLLVGRKGVLNELLPQQEVVFLRFGQEDDTTPVQQAYMKAPVLKAIDKVWDLVEPHNAVTMVRDAFFETPVPSYPEDVVREALLNALMHRDYTRGDPVQVRLYTDRLEVGSPGGFIAGITPDNILTHEPARRNPLLAEVFQHLGVVNRAGLGVDRMYRRLLSYGKLPPVYPEQPGAVVVELHNHTFDEPMATLVGRKAKAGHGWRLEELIVLHYLRSHDRVSTPEAAKLLQKPQEKAAKDLARMEGVFLERIGTGRGTYYQLSQEVLASLGDKAKYTRIRGLSEVRKLELVRDHVRRHGHVTNEEVQQIAQVNRNQALRLLKKLRDAGDVRLVGGGRGAHYRMVEK